MDAIKAEIVVQLFFIECTPHKTKAKHIIHDLEKKKKKTAVIFGGLERSPPKKRFFWRFLPNVGGWGG